MIKPDPNNLRVHTRRNKQAIDQSLKELGAGRSILIDAADVVIGGNGVLEQAEQQGMKIRVVESDGSELIAVKRTDLATNDPKRQALAIADNRIGETSHFDEDKLAQSIKDMSERLRNATAFDDREIRRLIEKSLPQNKPEIEFSAELLESHNYVVLFFDNEVDWLQAKTLFDIKTVQSHQKSDKLKMTGIGRVLRGSDAIQKILDKK